MSSQSCSNTLPLKDIMNTGFLMSTSSSSNSSGSSLFLDGVPKSEAWENITKGSTVTVKVTETPLRSVKEDLQISCDSGTSFCKTPFQSSDFDLSSANKSKVNFVEDSYRNTKSSTPFKEDKSSGLTESMFKSSETSDLVAFKKLLPPPLWEISGIQATVDNILSLDASLEDTGSLGCIKTDTPSLEMSHFLMPPDP